MFILYTVEVNVISWVRVSLYHLHDVLSVTLEITNAYVISQQK